MAKSGSCGKAEEKALWLLDQLPHKKKQLSFQGELPSPQLLCLGLTVSPWPALQLYYLNFLTFKNIQAMKGKEKLLGWWLSIWEGLSLVNNQHCF